MHNYLSSYFHYRTTMSMGDSGQKCFSFYKERHYSTKNGILSATRIVDLIFLQ